MEELGSVEKNKQEQESENMTEKVFCAMCGTELEKEQMFCPKCGHKKGDYIVQKKKGFEVNKIIIVAGVLALGIVIFLFIRGTQAKEVLLSKESITVKVGESTDLAFTINPENTKNKKVTWQTSNDSILSVTEGTVMGIKEGTGKITVKTANGKTDTCVITVEPAGPDLTKLYEKYCNKEWAEVASDGSYLSVDTNPDDIEDELEIDAMAAVYEINKALELPESVEEKMGKTRSLDGMQSVMGDGVELSWTYHPNNGLEVTYTLMDE